MPERPFESLCVVGAGFMGRQIGRRALRHGYTVCLVDADEGALAAAREAFAAEPDAAAWQERLSLTRDLASGTAAADLVIEAIPEKLELKRALFAELDAICPPHTILASNSSSLRIQRIEDVVQRRDRVLNLHYFAPVDQRPVVEIMGGSETLPEVLEQVRQFARRCDLTPLMVRKESTGFIFNRVWRAIKKECLRVVDQGIATHEDIDRAWMICYGTPRGPFGQMDLIGLDVVRDIEMVYYEESGDPDDAPPQVLLDKIARGELGVKTGAGFYTYPHPAYEREGWLRGE